MNNLNCALHIDHFLQCYDYRYEKGGIQLPCGILSTCFHSDYFKSLDKKIY